MKNIKYTNSTDEINPEMLEGFFSAWKRPFDPQSHYKILLNSSSVVLAIDDDTEKAVGLTESTGMMSRNY